MAEEDIPRILREIPPEKLRELIEALLGAPLWRQTSGSRREVVANPTEEQLRLPHNKLMGSKIMLHHRRGKLLFETDWLSSSDVSEFAHSIAQVMYLGAVSGSRYLKSGVEYQCADEWARLVGAEPGRTVVRWPERSMAARESMVRSICEGIMELVEPEAVDEMRMPCPGCGELCRADEIRCPHCGFGADPEPGV